MTELLRELEAVVKEIDQIAAVAASGLDRRLMDLTSKLRTHHAEIAEALADARRYRHICENLMTDRAGMFEVQQCIDLTTTECYMSKESVDEAVDAAIDAHNSAREVGE